MAKQLGTNKVRQGTGQIYNFRILIISTLVLAVLVVAGWIYTGAEDNEDMAEPMMSDSADTQLPAPAAPNQQQ